MKLVMVNPHRKVRLTITLQDKEGIEVPLNDTVRKLAEYVGDKMKEEDPNQTNQQVWPLMAQAASTSLTKLLGTGTAAVLLADYVSRLGFIHLMTVGFYLMKFIQKNELKIVTTETSIDDAELNRLARLDQASSAGVIAESMGLSARSVVEEMARSGKLDKEELESLGFEDIETNKDNKQN
jgi:hypothetical protein